MIGKTQRPFLAQFVSIATRERSLVDESKTIRTQMRSTIDLVQKMVAVAWDALYNTTP
jgi:hypothetical protein